MAKTALVTGSSNGIGESIAKELAKLDYKLVVTGRDEKDIRRVAEACKALSPSGFKPLEVVANLENESDVERLLESARVHFDAKLNLLVNNAGFGSPVAHSEPVECYKAFKRVLQVNLMAGVQLSLLAGPLLKRAAELSNEASNIVNIGSIASFRPSQTLFAYSTSKAAMNTLNECLAVEMAPLVRVNCVSPGPIETKIIERSGFSLDTFKLAASLMAPLRRVGQPEEVAQSVLFLIDPKRAAYVTGANLTLDGGTSIAPLVWDSPARD